ncbi:MAG: hypothetical protein Q4A41_04205 [Bacillota bacterium]|nr:hypothetical protein [Bacillota bacterium]
MKTFGNPYLERAALEQTYEDTFSVYDWKEIEKVNLTNLESTEVLLDEKCAFSVVNPSMASQDSHTSVEFEAKIYCAPEHEIHAGQTVRVIRFGLKDIGDFEVVGIPAIYPTHQEVKLKAKRLS